MLQFPILFAAVGLAAALQAAAAPQSADTLGGPAVTGVCLLSRQAVYANAKMGQAMLARLRTLAEEAQKEVDAERAPIETEVRKYNGEQAKLTEAQRQERQRVLAERLKPIEAKTALRQREIEATRTKAFERVAVAMQPVLAQVYKQHGCGLLVDRGTVLGGNMANDLTAQVVQGLDAKVTTIAFDREKLAPAPAPGSTGAN